MADNTNPQAVKFVNEELRPACDRAISAIRTLRQLAADYVAKGIGALVVPDQTTTNELIADGSETDGRTRLLGYDVDNAVGKANALLAALAADPTIEAALTKPTVNSQPVF